MVAEEPTRPIEVASTDAVEFLRRQAPWLFAPELTACVVGSHALAIACRHAGVTAPQPRDLDLAWALDTAAGQQLLREHGVFLTTTDGNLGRGTLAMRLGPQRVEITTLRQGDPAMTAAQRIAADLGARDMTIGALACELANGVLHDPHEGLQDFQRQRIAPVGDPLERVREHPVRWLRYFRKAHELGFELDRRLRRLDLPASLLMQSPKEALAAELRSALLRCASPGRLLIDLREAGLLAALAPELDLQFDGRPAGPQRFHPEVGQALHMVLALEWAVANGAHLDDADRTRLLVAVLCHDLGKGYTPAGDLPGHPGHERLGLQPLQRFLDRLPGLVDQRGKALARAVCELHVEIRRMHEMRPGTLATIYDRHLRAKDFPVELFVLAVAADTGGRLGFAAEGLVTRRWLLDALQRLRRCCEQIDAAALRQQHPGLEDFRRALHEARSRAIDLDRHAHARPRR
jgi:tRNA nucleotidyltransferase (CCA-adding enzyme)